MAAALLPVLVEALEIASVVVQAVVVAGAAAAGAYLDDQVVYPALGLKQDVQNVEGPRIDDIGFQTASWGSPMRHVQGPGTRVAGTVIWMSELKEVRSTTSDRGKGGGGVATTFSYFVDIAIGMCEGEIAELDALVIEGKRVYDREPDVSLAGTDIACFTSVTRQWTNHFIAGGVPHWDLVVLNNYLYLYATATPATVTKLNTLKVGEDATVAGFANGVNNATGNVAFVFPGTAGASYSGALIDLPLESPRYPAAHPWGTLVPAINEAKGPSVTVIQTGLPKYDPSILTGGVPTIYKGTTTQTADATIEADISIGVGEVSAYRDTAYFVIQDLALGPFGNRVPQIAAIIRKNAAPYTVGTAIGEHLERTGLVSADYDVSAATANLRGYAIAGPSVVSRALKPLLTAFGLLAKEEAGKIVIFKRSTPDQKVVLAGDFGAAPPGEAVSQPISIQDVEGLRLPSEVNLNYIDDDEEKQKGTAKYRKRSHPGDHVTNIDMPITMTLAEAHALARERLWATHANKKVVTGLLPPSYFHLQEGDLLPDVTVEIPGTPGIVTDVLVLDVQEGLNDIIKFTGVTEESQVFA